MKKLLLSVFVALLMSSTVIGQWVNIRPQLNAKFSQANGAIYMLGLASSTEAYVYSTVNDGTSWTTLNGVLLNAGTIYSFAVKNTTAIVVGTSSGIKYFNGASYSNSNITLSTKSVTCDGTNFYAGTSTGIYKSTNNGANWSSISGNLAGIEVTNILKVGITLLAGANNLYKSNNEGSNWTNITMPGNPCTYGNGTLWSGGLNGTNGELYRSINFGDNWVTDNLAYLASPYAIATSGTDVYITTSNRNVFHGSLQGSTYSYVLRNGGFPTQRPFLRCMVVGYNYLLAATDSAIWRSPLSYVTGTESHISTEIPDKFSLSQNYPNPFNPSTTIRYQISKAQYVDLRVFDITGKEIAVLVSESQTPGTYEVNWNASQYSSGVYFYKIESENFTDTKQMLLIK